MAARKQLLVMVLVSGAINGAHFKARSSTRADASVFTFTKSATSAPKYRTVNTSDINFTTIRTSAPNFTTVGTASSNYTTVNTSAPNSTTVGASFFNFTTTGTSAPNSTTVGTSSSNYTTDSTSAPKSTTVDAPFFNFTKTGTSAPNSTTVGTSSSNYTTVSTSAPNSTTVGATFFNFPTVGTSPPNSTTVGTSAPNFMTVSTSASNFTTVGTSTSNFTTIGVSFASSATVSFSIPYSTTGDTSFPNSTKFGTFYPTSSSVGTFSPTSTTVHNSVSSPARVGTSSPTTTTGDTSVHTSMIVDTFGPNSTTIIASFSGPPKVDKITVIELKNKVNELDSKNISKNVVKDIIKELSILTNLDMMDKRRHQNALKQQDLDGTIQILQKIVDLNISDSTLNILLPANNILDSRNTKAWRNITDDKIVRSLIITLENYGFQSGNNIKNNQNTTSIFQNYSNVQLRVKCITQRSNLSEEETLFKFKDTSFKLPSASLPQRSGAVVVVLSYRTMHLFLKTNTSQDYGKINTNIITASARPEPRKKFSSPVRITWNIRRPNESATCVYWEPEFNDNRWRTDGCVRVRDKSDKLICECDHLTAFAAMDISRNMITEDERKALELISTIGCSLSLFGIVLTILIYSLLWKTLHQIVRSNIPSQVLLHLCVAIGMTDILAILAGPARNYEIFCLTVSILLYFFVLAVFGWMLCEGIVIYLQLVNVYTGLALGGRHLKMFFLIGWGTPVFIVSLLVGLEGRDDFITNRACWCRGGSVAFWTFVGIIGLIVLINSTIFVLALRSVLSTRKMSTTRTLRSTRRGNNGANRAAIGTTLRNAKVVLKSSAILLPILGLTWLFGLLVFDRDTIVFKYLFAICNSLQGMMIFLFHVVINRKVCEAISRKKKFRARKSQ